MTKEEFHYLSGVASDVFRKFGMEIGSIRIHRQKYEILSLLGRTVFSSTVESEKYSIMALVPDLSGYVDREDNRVVEGLFAVMACEVILSKQQMTLREKIIQAFTSKREEIIIAMLEKYGFDESLKAYREVFPTASVRRVKSCSDYY